MQGSRIRAHLGVEGDELFLRLLRELVATREPLLVFLGLGLELHGTLFELGLHFLDLLGLPGKARVCGRVGRAWIGWTPLDAAQLAPLSPIDDLRGSAAYRQDVVVTLLRRLLAGMAR